MRNRNIHSITAHVAALSLVGALALGTGAAFADEAASGHEANAGSANATAAAAVVKLDDTGIAVSGIESALDVAGFTDAANADGIAAVNGADSDKDSTAVDTNTTDSGASTGDAEGGNDGSSSANSGSSSAGGSGSAAGTDSSGALGAVVNGWGTDAAGVRHWYDEGVMAADKAFYDPGTDAWYWADADGSIATGKDVFIPVSNEDRSQGKWVRFDESSRMVKGEDYRYGGWYYFDQTTGEMAKGFRFVDSNGGKWVCYDRVTGQMHHGQANDSGHWYLFDENTGATQYGFQYIASDNKWVFYDRTMGWMLYGEQAIDGSWYYLDENTGAVAYGWKTLPAGKTVYYDTTTGIMKYGAQSIDGRWYWFDQYTGALDRQGAINKIISTAQSLLGVPYVWLGVYPQDGGMDCASFTWYLYKQLGIDIGFETYDQMYSGYSIASLSDAKPGDLVLMYDNSWPNYDPNKFEHVVLYAGDGMIYEEPTFGGQCQYVSIYSKGMGNISIRRIIAD